MISWLRRWIEYRIRISDGKSQMTPFNRKAFNAWAQNERRIIMSGDERDEFKRLIDMCSGLNIDRVIYNAG